MKYIYTCKHLIKNSESFAQFIKFITVGVLNTLIGLAVFYFFSFLGFHYSLALGLSYGVGIINSYIWNKKWTFQGKGNVFVEMLRFVLIYLCSYLINLLLMYIFVEKIDIVPEISIVITLLLTTAISFIGHKLWSFNH